MISHVQNNMVYKMKNSELEFDFICPAICEVKVIFEFNILQYSFYKLLNFGKTFSVILLGDLC